MKTQYLKGLVVEMMNCIKVEDYDLAIRYGEKIIKLIDNEEEFILNDAEV